MTFIDRFLVRVRNKGVLLYTGIILVSTGYVFWMISTLPEVPPEPKKKDRDPVEDSLRAEERRSAKEHEGKAVKAAGKGTKEPVPKGPALNNGKRV